MTNLFWFRNDLRLADNPGLARLADAGGLVCAYFWPHEVPWCNTVGIGAQRRRFLLESLRALREELRAQGQELLVFYDAPEKRLPSLVKQFRVARIGVAAAPGVYESWEVDRVSRATGLTVELTPGNTLFGREAPQPQLTAPARHFTPFREQVSSLSVDRPVAPAPLNDPDGEFTARWDGYRAPQPEFVVDAADWPIDPALQ